MGKVKAIGEGLKAISQYALKPDKVRAYHGSTVPIEKLEHAKAQDTHGRQNALGLGRGKFYFSKDEPVARSYSLLRGADKPVVNEADLTVNNPIHEDDYGQRYRELTGRGINEPYDNDYQMLDRDMYIEQLDRQIREAGHDAIVNDVGQVAIFDPEQAIFIKKYGIAAAVSAGVITTEQAEAAQQQGMGAAPKGDRLGTPSKDETMQQRLALARQMSGSADRRATGATSPERPPEAPLTFGGALASGLSGARNSVEDWLGSGGGMRGMGNLTPKPEQVRDITDRYTPKPVQDWTRYESQSPVEKAWKWLAEQVTF